MIKSQVLAAMLAAVFCCPTILGAGAGETLIGPVTKAGTTEIPACTSFVDAAAAAGGAGTAQNPHKTIIAAVENASSGAVICVAEGTYAEQIAPGEKYFTLAGGFQAGTDFKVRDAAKYVSKAQGKGGSFLRIVDPGPVEGLTAIDGFEITGYSQAILRDFYVSQRFDVTNNFIHDNTCADHSLAGAGVALINVSGAIRGNVFSKNSCGRGGALFLNDSTNQNTVSIESNFVDANSGTEPDSAHGGAFYLFGNTLKITGNLITNNSVTQWGGGLYVGAFTPGNQPTTATLSGNVYRGNRAGDSGGGFFCDDGATCNATNEIYDGNCGGNVLVDGGSGGSGPTTTRFDHITNVGALAPGCGEPGDGFFVDTYQAVAPDSHTVTNAIFWGNAEGRDVVAMCGTDCNQLKVSVAASLVQTKYADGTVKVTFGPGNIAPADPLFVAPAKGDFQLKPGSPAIGKASDGGNLGAQSPGPPPAVPDIRGETTPKGAGQKPTGIAAAPAAATAQPEVKGAKPLRTEPRRPAVARGGKFMGFPERFNRYYTDSAWKPATTVYVSSDGDGDGATRDTPRSAKDAVAAAHPGTLIHFNRGRYEACYELSKETSGTYDEPIVLYGERNPDKTLGVSIDCCKSGRQSCVNLEGADYVAIDGFELVGGKYGVRAIGTGFAASEHARGTAVLNSNGHDQEKDPFFTGQSDWTVIEGNLAYGAKKGDGHGIYLSNGGDWNIARFNETYGNLSSDFQINADPVSTCQEVGIAFDDPRCDAYAGEGEGGQGASDYFIVEGNYFHHGLANGPNFTSVRRSIVRNNIFGPQVRHNVSFWQETDNPRLGSSDNKILHNLFITTAKHGVKFEAHSTRNEFANNVILGIAVANGTAVANPAALLMEVDDTVGNNIYRGNRYVSGKMEGREPNADETAQEDFSPAWFANFPTALNHDPNDFTPTADAPFLGAGKLSSDAPSDRNGVKRSGRVDLGPIEAP